MAYVVFAKIRFPIFSIKHPEAFQIRSSLFLPQPSTLIGALAYCLGVSQNIGLNAYKRVLEYVSNKKILAAKPSLLKDIPPLTVSSIVLRRFRIVDKAFETKEKGGRPPIKILYEYINKGEIESARKIIEVQLTDAFYREYISGYEILCAWAFRDDFDFNEELIYLIHRLGDTESLCSVIKVWKEEAKEARKKIIETTFVSPLKNVKTLIGNYVAIKMCNELRKKELFAIPYEITYRSSDGKRIMVIKPTTIKIEYASEVPVLCTSYGDIVQFLG